jgi:hypothetical protein
MTDERVAFEAYVKETLEASGQAAPPEKVRDVAIWGWAVGFETPRDHQQAEFPPRP